MIKIVFFFFQAEDGIRDVAVTGVRRVLFRSPGPYREAALAEPPRGQCAARVRLDVEPLVSVLRHAAVREAVGGLVGDEVHSREPQSLCRAQDGGGVVRIEQAVEHDGDALQARLDHGLDARLALRGEQRPVETGGRVCGFAVALVPAQDVFREPARTEQVRRIDRRDRSHPWPWRAGGTQVRRPLDRLTLAGARATRARESSSRSSSIAATMGAPLPGTIGCASRSSGAGNGAESSTRMVAARSSSSPSPVAPETRWTSILRRFSFLRS